MFVYGSCNVARGSAVVVACCCHVGVWLLHRCLEATVRDCEGAAKYPWPQDWELSPADFPSISHFAEGCGQGQAPALNLKLYSERDSLPEAVPALSERARRNCPWLAQEDGQQAVQWPMCSMPEILGVEVQHVVLSV